MSILRLEYNRENTDPEIGLQIECDDIDFAFREDELWMKIKDTHS